MNLIKALASRHQTDVLTLRPASGELPFVERFMKTRMLRVPVGHGTLAEKVEAFSRAIRRQLEGEEYEIVHLRSAWGGRAVFAGMQSGRVVYEVARSIEGEPRAADAGLAARLRAEEQLCLEGAHMVLVPTSGARHHLLERGLDPHRVFAVPPGVDVDHFDWEEESNGVDRVLYAGQISGGRGIRLLVDAVGRLRRRRPVKLVLAGAVEESFRPALDAALKEASLGEDDIELLGAIDHDDMPRVIAHATVCVAPASPDAQDRPLAGFPTKLLEYMACRRAVVAPRRASVEEVVEDGQDGLLFAPGDADELMRALEKLLEDRALRGAVADSGYRRVRLEFPASATRRRLLEAYGNLLPASAWVPPGRGAESIDAFPASPDTTARRPSPFGRDSAEVSGTIEIPSQDTIPIDVVEGDVIAFEEEPREIVIEAVDFEEAGEARDATIEPDGVSIPAPAANPPSDPFGDEESKTRPFGVRLPEASTIAGDELPEFVAAGPLLGHAHKDDPDDDGEATSPGPLRTRRPSG